MRDVPLWFVCYGLLGIAQSGMIPILLPLTAPPGPAGGLTYAAYVAAGLAAPAIGVWSDRGQRHWETLTAGLLLIALGLLAAVLVRGLVPHLLTSALIGLGATAANTVGTMMIVENEPQARWDERIGTLQEGISLGQLIGLLLAGALATTHPEYAYLVASGLLVLAVPMALVWAPRPGRSVARQAVAPRAARVEATAMGPNRSFHHISWRALGGLAHSGLAWFIAAWFVSYTATNSLAVMFAVAMVREFHLPATWPTAAYAIGVGCGLGLYRVATRWEMRSSPWTVLLAGLSGRAAIVVAMALLAADHAAWTALPMLVAFGLTQFIWPLLSVSSNTLAVRLNPAHRSESVGLLNAATSLAATIGSILGGLLLALGFVWLCVATVAALGIAILIAAHPGVRISQPAPAE